MIDVADESAVIDALRGRLLRLPLRVDRITVETREIAIPSYPGGPRPTSRVLLSGAGCHGCGEHVGWTLAEHMRFAAACTRLPTTDTHCVGDLYATLRETLPEVHDRAAVEAAAVALALRQHRTDLASLLGRSPRPVRYVVSLDARSDPLPRIREERLRQPAVKLKLDVDPSWDDALLDRIAREGGVAILDFKGRGSARDHERFAQRFPESLLEDALAPEKLCRDALRARRSLDAPLDAKCALGSIAPRPAAVNVKPARVGGILDALILARDAARLGCTLYFGGMFEVGVGRLQLRALAALLSPDGPNDIAPILPPNRPERLDPFEDTSLLGSAEIDPE